MDKKAATVEVQSNRKRRKSKVVSKSGDNIDFIGSGTKVTTQFIDSQINEYVDALVEWQNMQLSHLESAIRAFLIALSTDVPTKDADPDIAGTVFGSILSSIVEQTFGAVSKTFAKKIGANVAIDLIKSVANEISVNGKNDFKNTSTLGTWLASQNILIEAKRATIDKHGVFEDMMNIYDEETDKDVFMKSIHDTTEILHFENGPTLETANKRVKKIHIHFYEKWILSHDKKSVSDEATGCIEIKLDVHGGNILESVTIEAPGGDKMAHALNELGVRPFSLKVRKRLCLKMGTIAGNVGWQCGWLDEDSEVRIMPVNPAVKEKFKGVELGSIKAAVKKFKE